MSKKYELQKEKVKKMERRKSNGKSRKFPKLEIYVFPD